MSSITDDGFRDRVVRSIGWVAVERWGSRILQFVVFAVLARLIGPEGVGIAALAMAFLGILQVFVDAGFSRALVQLQRMDVIDVSTAFWTSISIALVVWCLTVLASGPVAMLLGEPALAAILPVMATILPLAAFVSLSTAVYERELLFRKLSIRQLSGTVTAAGVALFLAFAGFGVWALVAQAVVASAVAAILLWWSAPIRPKFLFSRRSFNRLRVVGFSVLGADLLDAIQSNLDRILIGAVLSPSALGYYYVAQRFAAILVELASSVLSRVSLTVFSRVQDEEDRLSRIFLKLTAVAAFLGIPAFGLAALLSPQLFAVFFGDGWGPSIPVFWVLCGAWFLLPVLSFDRPLLIARNRAGVALALAASQSALGVGLLLALLPFGSLGVAASRIAPVLLWPVRLHFLRKVVRLNLFQYFSTIVRMLAAFVPVGIAVAMLQRTDWASVPNALFTFVLPVSSLAILLYAAFAYRFATSDTRSEIFRRPLRAAARTIVREYRRLVRR